MKVSGVGCSRHHRIKNATNGVIKISLLSLKEFPKTPSLSDVEA